MTEILQFSGRESPEDAAVWLNRLIASTGSFSDSGVLRFLGSRLEADSPARRWFDALDAGIKVSWPLFERKFLERWITNPRSQPSELDVRDLFRAHTLPQELLTGDLLSDPASYQAKLFVWAEDHLHMGKRTGYRDPDLIQATERLLPGFIQAHLHTYGDPNSSFDACCRRLKTIPEETLEFERIRLERSSGDWRSAMESKIDQISNMVQRLITFMGADKMYEGLPSSVANNEVTDNADTTSLLANEPSNASVLLEVNNSRTDSDNLEINFNAPSELRESSQQPRSSRSNVKEISRALGWRINLTDLIRSTYAKVTSETLPTGDHLMSDEDSTSGRLLWAVIGMQKRNLLGADAHALVNNCTRAWEQYNNASGKLTDVVSPTQKSVSTKGRKPKTTTLHLQASGKPTAAGGIFKRNATLDQPYVDPQLSVWYMVLSAYLAEFNTGDRRYRDAAIQSAHYILDHMLDPATGLIKDVYINAVTGQQVDGNLVLSSHWMGNTGPERPCSCDLLGRSELGNQSD
ncbi:hypothetical protein FRC03_011716 [Tulasnella sp. 419]|nr:hypothetical protein FRC03_011716 [Tulasnella sp. 419]